MVPKMQLSLAILLSVCSLSLAQLLAPVGHAYAKCNVEGQFSKVKCVSKTKFLLPFQEIGVDVPMDCPPGKVCTDSVEICSEAQNAVCYNDMVGSDGFCNVCPTGPMTYNPICVSQTEYAFCINGKIQETMKFKCGGLTPFCKATFEEATPASMISICSANPLITDCPADPMNPLASVTVPGNMPMSVAMTVPMTVPTICRAEGLFPIPNDRSCKSYYKCQQMAPGIFDQMTFTCSTVGYVFDPTVQRCVPEITYVCPY